MELQILLRSADIRDRVAMLSDIVPRFWCFFGRQILLGRVPYFWLILHFYNLCHHRSCWKVWWRTAKRPQRLGGEKRGDWKCRTWKCKTWKWRTWAFQSWRCLYLRVLCCL